LAGLFVCGGGYGALYFTFTVVIISIEKKNTMCRWCVGQKA